jgi:hypothetical protein
VFFLDHLRSESPTAEAPPILAVLGPGGEVGVSLVIAENRHDPTVTPRASRARAADGVPA